MSVLIDDETNAYPKELIADCSSAALLFCSGRMGAGDGYWYKDSGLTDVQCVDWDDTTLGPYRSIYPAAWTYTLADAFAWAPLQDRTWDIVSVDMPSQYAGDMFASVPLWTRIANKYVVSTIMGYDPLGEIEGALPDGWEFQDCIKRAEYDDGRIYHWLVLNASS